MSPDLVGQRVMGKVIVQPVNRVSGLASAMTLEESRKHRKVRHSFFLEGKRPGAVPA
jgi:hypothetical protein